MPLRDERWLQQRRRRWYVIQEIPRDLRPRFLSKNGKPLARLVKSLETESYEVAKAKRHKVLAEFAAQFESARGNRTHGNTVDAALAWRDHAMRQETPEDQLVAEWDIEGSAAEIPDPQMRETFRAIATGQQTPLEPFLDRWLAEEDIEARSKGDHRRAVKELLAWAEAESLAPTLETFTRRTAGKYVSHLLGKGMDRSKTVSKRLWSLSRFWAWMGAKGHADDNPWRGHQIGKNGRSARDKAPERPFTVTELHTLLNGDAGQPLADLMRLALFSGARIEELALLQVRDIDATERTMSIQADPKTPSARRIVPVHSAVWPLVQARLKDKAPDAFLLYELGPAPKEGRQRSMAISKAFGRYREGLGVDDTREGQRRSLVNFHSFRRTFITLAEQAGQPETTIRSVVGHKRQGMTFGTYSGGPSLAQRRACVEAVQLPKA